MASPATRDSSTKPSAPRTWQRTKHPGVYVRHRKGCPRSEAPDERCRCKPAYRASRRHPVTGKVISSGSYRDLNEALTWLAAAGDRAAPLLRERAAAGPTFKELADQWWDGVEHGRIGKRRGKRAYSDTTLQGYDRSLRHHLLPEFAARPAGEISSRE